MAVLATYPERSKSKNISGFKIVGCLTPGQGFNGAFYVYLHEKLDNTQNSDNKFDPISLSAVEPIIQGTVTLESDDRNIAYTFDEIDLIEIRNYYTYKIKHRILVFKYDNDKLGRDNLGASLLIKANNKLRADQLEPAPQPYTYGVNGGSEALLGFESILRPSGYQVLKFTSFRTSSNSFLKYAVDLHSDIVSGNTVTPSFSANNVEIDGSQGKLDFLYVDESWGTFLNRNYPALESFLDAGGNYDNFSKELGSNFFKPYDYYRHFVTKPEPNINYGENSIETGIVVLRNGEGKQIAPKII